MSIRAWILGLVVACILPAWLVAGFLTYLSYERSRERIEQDVVATSHALFLGVQGSFSAIEGRLDALATSPDLERGDLAGFYRQSQQVLSQSPGLNIVLVDLALSKQVINTYRPYGAPLPQIYMVEWDTRVANSGKPALSPLFIGSITHKPVIALAVPINRGDRASYILSMALDAGRLNTLMEQQGLPTDWRATILDREDNIAADTSNRDDYVGKKAPVQRLDIPHDRDSGLVKMTGLDGTPMLASFHRDPALGITVSVGVPQSLLDADLRRSLWTNLIGTVLFLLAGLVLAGRIGQAISRPILSLIEPALALGRGALESIPPLHLTEARQVGDALVQAQELIRLRSMERDDAKMAAMTDGLTGLANRRRFDEVLETEMTRLKRSSLPISLIVLDVDHFKKFNDSYGHVAGDDCLRRVAQAIDTVVKRPSDLAARYGGEEFACILPEIDVAGATALAERIRVQVAQLEIPHRASSAARHVTISLGVTSVIPAADIQPSQLIAMADEALYHAKDAGRNRVECTGLKDS